MSLLQFSEQSNVSRRGQNRRPIRRENQSVEITNDKSLRTVRKLLKISFWLPRSEQTSHAGTYLNQYQFLPYDRMKEMFWDLFSRTISCGTLYRWNKECFRKLEATEQKIRSEIINSEVGYFDETGIRCKTALHWLHNGSTSWATCYILHARRGQETMDALVSYQ